MRWMLVMLTLFLLPVAFAANDPGHDPLYIEETGDSELTGDLNVTEEVRVTHLLYSTNLHLLGNGTILGAPSQPRVMGGASQLYLDSTGNLYLNTKGGTSGIVQLGDVATNAITLNVSGVIRQQNVLVCLANGSNCPAGAAESGNVTGSGTANYVPKWISATELGDSVLYDDGTRVGIGTTSPQNFLHVNSTDDTNVPVRIELTDGASGGNWTALLINAQDNNAATEGAFINWDFQGISGTGPGIGAYRTSTTEADIALYVTDADAQYEALRIQGSSGNVGIGTGSPDQELHVIGSTCIETSDGGCSVTDAGTTAGGIYINNGDSIYFENAKHAITYNDGEGNFNIRIGHISNSSPDEVVTEAGHPMHMEWGQSTGQLQFNFDDTSRAVGDSAVWDTNFIMDEDGTFSLTGGLHVGGTSAPGDDNLLVDGTASVTGVINADATTTAISADGDIALTGSGDDITFTGGTISDATDGVDIADDLEVSGDVLVGSIPDRSQAIVDAAGKFLSNSTAPGLILIESDATADENWWIDTNNGQLRFLTVDDDLGTWATALILDQASGTPTGMSTSYAINADATTTAISADGDIVLTGAGDNVAFTSTGGITLTGGTISDATDEVDIADSLAVTNDLQIDGWASFGTGAAPAVPFAIQYATSPQFRILYDASNYFLASVSSAGDTTLSTSTNGKITLDPGSADDVVELRGDVEVSGTTPQVTIGDAGAEDTAVLFDGSAQDFHIGIDDTTDDLTIGTGSVLGTNTLMVVENGGNVGVGIVGPTARFEDGGVTGAESNISLKRVDGAISTAEVLGSLLFRGTDSGVRTGAMIVANSTNAWSADTNDAPTALYFYTQSNGGTNNLDTPKMVIEAAGNVGIGTMTPASQFQIGTGTVLQQWTGSTPYVYIQGVDNEVATSALLIEDENLLVMLNVSSTGDSTAGEVTVGGDLIVEGQAYGVAPTMYLTSGTATGAHECDDTPSTCCATGYHMCDNNEVNHGGRQIEFSGTGRDTTPFNEAGDVINGKNAGNDAEGDCTAWSSTGGGVDDRWQCTIAHAGTWSCSATASACTSSLKQWCCSD